MEQLPRLMGGSDFLPIPYDRRRSLKAPPQAGLISGEKCPREEHGQRKELEVITAGWPFWLRKPGQASYKRCERDF